MPSHPPCPLAGAQISERLWTTVSVLGSAAKSHAVHGALQGAEDDDDDDFSDSNHESHDDREPTYQPVPRNRGLPRFSPW